MKVFISYSRFDRSTAESLYRDLRSAGAEPFEFRESAMGDAAAFSEIISWIYECDAFVVLISARALASVAVQEEVRTANHCYIESERTNPAKIISAIVEPGAAAPRDIARLSQIELLDYSDGLPKLFRLLGLEPPPRLGRLAAPSLPAIDFDKLALDYEPPAQRSEWFKNASKLIARYDKFKPADLPKEKEADHVDSLLAEMSGRPTVEFADPDELAKVESAFLGVEPSETTHLSDALLRFDVSKANAPLEAPLLSSIGDNLIWNPVLGATGYVVEQRYGSDVLGPEEVYRGTEMSYTIDALSHMFIAAEFRVKATGGVFRPDSPWSNAVRFDAVTTLLPGGLGTAPPTLTLNPGPLKTLEWSPVDNATGYVVERTERALIGWKDSWQSVYEGDATTYFDFDRMGKTGLTYAYRVKALGAWGETAWSGEVTG